MENCHECADMIDILNKELDEEVKEFEKVIKKSNYNNCLKFIHLIMADMEDKNETLEQDDPDYMFALDYKSILDQIQYFNGNEGGYSGYFKNR
tara:strand:+ start:83 stop:361 length:279 start_codon:yes stop_codon:yes gene_type:complete